MPRENCEELRFALVMNGGVSLAVWMGGVTTEIFRLVKEKHPVYTGLLALTRTVPRVDVISGTSAGGVNGAALSVALLYDGDFAELRDVWMKTATFNDLLRPPLGDNPGSLLKGDDYFLPRIRDALAHMARNRSTARADLPVDLRLTTTLLSGHQGNTVDDLGSPLNDVDYRAYFHFTTLASRGASGTAEDFSDRTVAIERMARAARSSASFPFAFEPSLIEREDKSSNLMGRFGDELETPRYVVDGGVLDNKPFRGALEAMLEMGRKGSVRRVLMYINPDPGDGPANPKPGVTMPPLSAVVTASLLGIPQSQSIADQLQEIRRHNDAVRHRRNNVLSLVERLNAAQLLNMAQNLFPIYRRRRIIDVFESVFEDLEIEGALGRLVGKRRREHMQDVFTRGEWSGWIPGSWPSSSDALCNQKESWAWGMFPVEFAAKVMLDMLRIAQNLYDYAYLSPVTEVASERGESVPDLQNRNTGTPKPTSEAAAQESGAFGKAWARFRQPVAIEDWDPDESQGAEPEETYGCEGDNKLSPLWVEASELVQELAQKRRDEKGQWAKGTRKLIDKLNLMDSPGRSGETQRADVKSKDFEEQFEFILRPERRIFCAHIMYRIASVIERTCPLAIDIVLASKANGRMRQHESAQAESLNALASYLMTGPGGTQLETIYKILQLEVIEFSFDDHERLREDTLIELVQLSGNSRSPIGGNSTAKSKLLGLQLAHFGAFYKQSWRANDWTYGRLDGSEHLVRVLLNPERLHRFYFGRRDDLVQKIEEIALAGLDPGPLKRELTCIWARSAYSARIRQELAFLDDINCPLPDNLPTCAEVITLRLHYGILRREIPALMSAVASDQTKGADVANAGETLRRMLAAKSGTVDPFSPEQAAQCLSDGLLASEKLADEAGSDLFTRSLAHTLATVQNTLASKAARLGPVGAVFAALKVPILGFYFVARGLTHQSRTSAALNGAILVLGVFIVAAVMLGFLGAVPKPLVTTGWILFAYGLTMAIIRLPRTVGIPICFAIIYIALRADSTWFHWGGAIVVLLAASIALPALQYIVGFMVLVLCGLLSSNQLVHESSPPMCKELSIYKYVMAAFNIDVCHEVMLLTWVVMVTLVFAIWQATSLAGRMENAARATIRWMMHPKRDLADSLGHPQASATNSPKNLSRSVDS